MKPLAWSRAVAKSDVAPTAKRLIPGLIQAADADGMNCHPGHKSLAGMAGVSEKTVQRGIGVLVSAGWLTVVQRANGYRGMANVYELTEGRSVEAPPGTGEPEPAPVDTEPESAAGEPESNGDGPEPWDPNRIPDWILEAERQRAETATPSPAWTVESPADELRRLVREAPDAKALDALWRARKPEWTDELTALAKARKAQLAG